MNDKELEELNRNVQLAGICREKYIRCALMGITIHPRAPDSCKALARQVAAVGNNLNVWILPNITRLSAGVE